MTKTGQENQSQGNLTHFSSPLIAFYQKQMKYFRNIWYHSMIVCFIEQIIIKELMH